MMRKHENHLMKSHKEKSWRKTWRKHEEKHEKEHEEKHDEKHEDCLTLIESHDEKTW